MNLEMKEVLWAAIWKMCRTSQIYVRSDIKRFRDSTNLLYNIAREILPEKSAGPVSIFSKKPTALSFLTSPLSLPQITNDYFFHKFWTVSKNQNKLHYYYIFKNTSSTCNTSTAWMICSFVLNRETNLFQKSCEFMKRYCTAFTCTVNF